MSRIDSLDGWERAPRWILIFAGAHVLLSLLTLWAWRAATHSLSTQVSASSGTGPLFGTVFAAVGAWLCWLVLRSFPAGAPLRTAWLLVAAAAACRALCGAAMHLVDFAPGWTEQLRAGTLALGGPVQMALLAIGLWMGLREWRRFGFWVRPRITDWVVAGVLGLFVLVRFGEAAVSVMRVASVGAIEWTALAATPLVCVLFLEGLLLRRSLSRVGRGLVVKCWSTLTAAVLITGGGQMAVWAMERCGFPAEGAAIGTSLSLAGAVAFALAPAYQLAAQRHALRQSQARESLSPGFRRSGFGSTQEI